MTGKIVPWKESLNSPSFFEIGENSYSDDYEYVDMSEADMLSALEEFLSIENWEETPLQKEYKKALTPLHLELFYAQGAPCDCYLRKTNS